MKFTSIQAPVAMIARKLKIRVSDAAARWRRMNANERADLLGQRKPLVVVVKKSPYHQAISQLAKRKSMKTATGSKGVWMAFAAKEYKKAVANGKFVAKTATVKQNRKPNVATKPAADPAKPAAAKPAAAASKAVAKKPLKFAVKISAKKPAAKMPAVKKNAGKKPAAKKSK